MSLPAWSTCWPLARPMGWVGKMLHAGHGSEGKQQGRASPNGPVLCRGGSNRGCCLGIYCSQALGPTTLGLPPDLFQVLCRRTTRVCMCAHKCVPLHFSVGPRDPEFVAYRVQGYAWPHRLVFCICSCGYTKIALFFQGKNALLALHIFLFSPLQMS